MKLLPAFLRPQSDRPIPSSKRIAAETERRIQTIIQAGPQKIDKRLKDLHREWDIERAIEANSSAMSLVGLTLGASSNRRWFILPSLVAVSLLQHSLTGWSLWVPLLRQFGFRTPQEIDEERFRLMVNRNGLTLESTVAESFAYSARGAPLYH
jgi:hypothetical protein